METLIGLFCALLSLLIGVGLPILLVIWGLDSRSRIRGMEADLVHLRKRMSLLEQASHGGVAETPSAPSPTETPVVPVVLPQSEPPVTPAVEAPTTPPHPEPPPRPSAPPAPPPRPRPPAPPPRPPRPLPPIETLAAWAAAAVGGLLLVLAVLFGLREAIKAGWIGPPLRFALGMGTGLLAATLAELLESRRYRLPAAALSGAAAAIFYGVLYAGHARYGILGQASTFGLMVAVSSVTMLAAVRRDSLFMAILATAGGFLTPILLSTGENRAIAFMGYLALVDLGVVVAATRRRWPILVLGAAGTTALLYLGWALRFRAPDQVPVALVSAAGLAALFYGLALARRQGMETVAGLLGGSAMVLAALSYVAPADPGRIDPASYMSLSWDLAGTPWMVLGFVGLVMVALPAIGRRIDHLAARLALAPVAGLVLLVYGLSWTFTEEPPSLALGIAAGLLPALAGLAAGGGMEWLPLVGVGAVTGLVATGVADPPLQGPLLLTSLGLGLGTIGIGWMRDQRIALLLGLVAGMAPLLVAAPGLIEGGQPETLFFGLAALYAAAAWPPFLRPREEDLWGVVAAAAAGPIAFLGFRLLWLDALGPDWIGLLALLLGASALLGAISLVRVLRVRADNRELAVVIAVVLSFAAGAVPLQLEEAWLTVGWAVEVGALAFVSLRLRHQLLPAAGALLAVGVGLRLLANPEALRYGSGEGMILLNWTLYTWGVPGALLLVAAGVGQNGWPEWLRKALRVEAILIFFALVNLEVSHAFAHDRALSFTSADRVESMTRSIAWGGYGLLLLLVGLNRDSRAVRLGGFGFMVLAVAKLFLFDLVFLEGLARVGAFAGLAVALLLAAVVFQRIVLRDRRDE